MDIPTDELLADVRNHLRCLAPHVKQRLTALLLERLADRVETLQAFVAKLAKTKDGVPVPPGAYVWRDDEKLFVDYEGWCWTLEEGKVTESSEAWCQVKDSYSTQAAAMAAGGK